MVGEIEAALWRLTWRLTWWLITVVLRIFLRIFWLPILIVAAIYFVVVPVLLAVAHFAQPLLQPAAAVAVLLLFLWLWRR